MEHNSYEGNKIDIRKFKKGKEISQGRCGVVYEVEDIESKKLYAAKLIFCEEKEDEKHKELIKREIYSNLIIKHPAIINYLGYSTVDFDNKNNIVIFMELAQNRSLFDIIKNIMQQKDSNYLNNTIRQIILVGIARGMKYLHDCNIINQNLKLKNILLNSEFHPFISDFGHLCSQSQFNDIKSYQAPEILKGDNYNKKVDVYAFGILMFELLSNSFAYPEFLNGQISDSSLQDKIINELYRPEFTFPIKKTLQNLIERCWSNDPNERPSFDEIFKKLSKIDNDDYLLDDVDIKELTTYVNEVNGNDDSIEDILNKIDQLNIQSLENLSSDDIDDQIYVIQLQALEECFKNKLKIDQDDDKESEEDEEDEEELKGERAMLENLLARPKEEEKAMQEIMQTNPKEEEKKEKIIQTKPKEEEKKEKIMQTKPKDDEKAIHENIQVKIKGDQREKAMQENMQTNPKEEEKKEKIIQTNSKKEEKKEKNIQTKPKDEEKAAQDNAQLKHKDAKKLKFDGKRRKTIEENIKLKPKNEEKKSLGRRKSEQKIEKPTRSNNNDNNNNDDKHNGSSNKDSDQKPRELSLIYSKCYEKRSNLEHDFRELIHKIDQNCSEIFYLFQEDQQHEIIKAQINELLAKFDVIANELMREKEFAKRNKAVTDFYNNNKKSITNLRQSILNELYPLIQKVPSEFQEYANEKKCIIDLCSLFKSFEPNNKDIDFNKVSIIEPPHHFESKIKDEELLTKYDKFICIVNLIILLRDLINFEAKYHKENEECFKYEQIQITDVHPNKPTSNAFNQQFKLVSIKELEDERKNIEIEKKKIEEERKKIEEEKKKIREEEIRIEEKKKQFEEKMRIRIEEEKKMTQRINMSLNEKIDFIKKEEEKLKNQIKQYEEEKAKFSKWKSEMKSLIITDKQFLDRIDELEKRIISLSFPNPLTICNSMQSIDDKMQEYIDKIKDLSFVIAKIKSEMVEIKVIGQKYMMNYAALIDENVRMMQFMQSHNLHYKSHSSLAEKKQCNIY